MEPKQQVPAYRQSMDTLNGRYAKYMGRTGSWLFFLALLSPAGLFFSYVFMGDHPYFKEEYVLYIQPAVILVSVVFCSIWTASNDMREKVRVGSLFIGLVTYPVFQVGLHIGAMIFGWAPALWIMDKIK